MRLHPTLPLLLVTLEKKLSTHKPNKKTSVLAISGTHVTSRNIPSHTHTLNYCFLLLAILFPDQSKKKNTRKNGSYRGSQI